MVYFRGIISKQERQVHFLQSGDKHSRVAQGYRTAKTRVLFFVKINYPGGIRNILCHRPPDRAGHPAMSQGTREAVLRLDLS